MYPPLLLLCTYPTAYGSDEYDHHKNYMFHTEYFLDSLRYFAPSLININAAQIYKTFNNTRG
jgi:hypothetical protein